MIHGLSLDEKIKVWLGRCKRNGNGCLIWPGATAGQMGYAYVHYNKRGTYLTHLLLEQKLGRSLEKCALHTCDNPSCVEVSHLWEGTHSDNTHDIYKKGRGSRIDNWGNRRRRRERGVVGQTS